MIFVTHVIQLNHAVSSNSSKQSSHKFYLEKLHDLALCSIAIE